VVFFGFLVVSSVSNSAYAERCDVKIIFDKLDVHDEIIEDFDISDTEYNLRMTYYEKYFKNLDSKNEIVYLLPTENVKEERKKIMEDFKIYERIPSHSLFEGIGTPEDIIKFFSEERPSPGSERFYYFGGSSSDRERLDEWKEYWNKNSQNDEYANRVYAILQLIVPSTNSHTVIIEGADCITDVKIPQNQHTSPPPEEEVSRLIEKTRSDESRLFFEMLSLIFFVFALIALITAAVIFIQYKRKKIFQT